MLGPQATLLRRSAPFRHLFAARLISEAGSWLALIALTVVVYDKTHSAGWVAALTVVQMAPAIVLGLLFGPLVDVLPRKTLLIVSDLVNAAVFLCLTLVGSPLAIIALALLSGLASAFFRPAVFAVLPGMVEENEVNVGLSLLSASENLAQVAGPALGGLLLTVASPAALYLGDAASFILSALLVLFIPTVLFVVEKTGQKITVSKLGELKNGLSWLLHSSSLQALIALWAVAALVGASLNVVGVVLVKHALGGGNLAYGIFIAAIGAGLVVGSLLAGARATTNQRRRFHLGLVVLGTGAIVAGVSPTVWLAVVAFAAAGVGNAYALLGAQALLGEQTDVSTRGRAFMGALSIVQLAFILGAPISGALNGVLGARALFAASGAAIIIAVALSAAFSRVRQRTPEGAEMVSADN